MKKTLVERMEMFAGYEYVVEAKKEKKKVVYEKEGDKAEFQAFVKKKMKEQGITKISDLSDEEKKKFFDAVDAGWKADKETD